MPDLLLEIGTEEIPAFYLKSALADLSRIAIRLFKEKRIKFREFKSYGTPRRLILWGQDLAERQEIYSYKVLGPRVDQPEKAIEGFARSQGVSFDDLEREKTKRGERFCVLREEGGGEVKKFLNSLIPQLIRNLSFPKSMRWGEGELKFVRPIRWLLCLWDNFIIDFELEGVKSSNQSRGHRFMANRKLRIKNPADYFQQINKYFVLIDPLQRRQEIERQLEIIAAKRSANYLKDQELLEEVVNLVEYPVALEGSFKEKYLSLPEELLITVMKKQQRFFPLFLREDDPVSFAGQKRKIIPFFVGISNTRVVHPEVVKAGYERVLNARFADACFFFEEDKKISLEKFLPRLKGIIFQEQLGSLYEKTERITRLSSYLGEMIAPQLKEQICRVALLCKADLAAQMVYEFPELQGVMGREYARLAGEESEVSQAIFEHYLPRNAADLLPETDCGAIVSIADKLDTIVGCFSQDLIPTGSEDPYALRRQALGIINIIINRSYTFSLPELVSKTIEVYENQGARGKRRGEELEKKVREFFAQRLKNQWLSEGYAYDLIEAVIFVSAVDPFSSQKRLKALTEFRSESGFNELVVSFKRVVNILPVRTEDREQRTVGVNPLLFETDAERKLSSLFNALKDEVLDLIKGGEYLAALKKMSGLKGAVDNFFDQVLVICEEKKLRENRLSLLREISALFSEIADFRKIVV